MAAYDECDQNFGKTGMCEPVVTGMMQVMSVHFPVTYSRFPVVD